MQGVGNDSDGILVLGKFGVGVGTVTYDNSRFAPAQAESDWQGSKQINAKSSKIYL